MSLWVKKLMTCGVPTFGLQLAKGEGSGYVQVENEVWTARAEQAVSRLASSSSSEGIMSEGRCR